MLSLNLNRVSGLCAKKFRAPERVLESRASLSISRGNRAIECNGGHDFGFGFRLDHALDFHEQGVEIAVSHNILRNKLGLTTKIRDETIHLRIRQISTSDASKFFLEGLHP